MTNDHSNSISNEGEQEGEIDDELQAALNLMAEKRCEVVHKIMNEKFTTENKPMSLATLLKNLPIDEYSD